MEGAGGAAERWPTVDECAGRLQVTICRQARSFANGCRQTEKRERARQRGRQSQGEGVLTLSGHFKEKGGGLTVLTFSLLEIQIQLG